MKRFRSRCSGNSIEDRPEVGDKKLSSIRANDGRARNTPRGTNDCAAVSSIASLIAIDFEALPSFSVFPAFPEEMDVFRGFWTFFFEFSNVRNNSKNIQQIQ